MKNDSSIIPKIIVILAFLSITGIILLFFTPKGGSTKRQEKPEIPEKLFTQVILAAKPKILELWEEGDRFITESGLNCPSEIDYSKEVGPAYFRCQPHFWQCYWSHGVRADASLKIDLFGQIFHVHAKPSFDPIPAYSASSRYYQILHGPWEGVNLHYGVLVDLEVKEIPGLSWPVILTDTCRDTYLPERIYGYGKVDSKSKDEGFIWDNFGQAIFIDKFYVSQQQVNEWRLVTHQENKLDLDRRNWHKPGILSLKEQKEYCSFWGKRLLEAKLFDAASMSPVDLNNNRPLKVTRPSTPWQRDLSKTFLGIARINPDYQLTPLDCQLAQVKGCKSKYYFSDSISWMGINYSLGFNPESVINELEKTKNLKPSSRFEMANSELHELGVYTQWDGEQDPEKPVAFRCYEEVSI